MNCTPKGEHKTYGVQFSHVVRVISRFKDYLIKSHSNQFATTYM